MKSFETLITDNYHFRYWVERILNYETELRQRFPDEPDSFYREKLSCLWGRVSDIIPIFEIIDLLPDHLDLSVLTKCSNSFSRKYSTRSEIFLRQSLLLPGNNLPDSQSNQELL